MSGEQKNKVLKLTRGIAAIPPEPPSPAQQAAVLTAVKDKPDGGR